jgi:hypothetical protein
MVKFFLAATTAVFGFAQVAQATLILEHWVDGETTPLSFQMAIPCVDPSLDITILSRFSSSPEQYANGRTPQKIEINGSYTTLPPELLNILDSTARLVLNSTQLESLPAHDCWEQFHRITLHSECPFVTEKLEKKHVFMQMPADPDPEFHESLESMIKSFEGNEPCEADAAFLRSKLQEAPRCSSVDKDSKEFMTWKDWQATTYGAPLTLWAQSKSTFDTLATSTLYQRQDPNAFTRSKLFPLNFTHAFDPRCAITVQFKDPNTPYSMTRVLSFQ